jgi:hypothetical protein
MSLHVTEIHHPSQLNALSTFTLLRRRGRGKITLSKSFDHPQRQAFEKAINKHYHACGCDTSAAWLLLGLLAGAAYNIYQFMQVNEPAGRAIASTLLIALAAGIAGKAVGLLRANQELKRTIHTIQAYWPTEPSTRKNQIDCG